MPSNFDDFKVIRTNLRLSLTTNPLPGPSGEEPPGPYSSNHVATQMLAPFQGPLQQRGTIRLSGAGTKDGIAIKALTGTDDRAFLFLHMQGFTSDGPNPNKYVKVGLRSAHGSDSASGDWFATLPQNGVLFMPISNMQNIDLESSEADYQPHVDYILLQRER